MSYFVQAGDKFYPAQSKEALLEGLPPGNFAIEQSMSGLYFKRIENFQPLNKVYGHLNTWAERTLQTFEDREVSTGILLSGEKGSGKSLLGRLISLKAHDKDIPTVVINVAIDGALLISLLGELTQPVVVFFDEFEKVYHDKDVQESVLSLLDGTLGTKHLFVITCNDIYRLTNFLINRPGRIFYAIEFNGLEEGFIREYCEDSLNNKSEIDNIIKLSKIFEKFNFDMLKSLVEEMNRYNESALKAVELLNIVPNKQYVKYNLAITDNKGKEYKTYPEQWSGFPLENDRFDAQIIVKGDEDDDNATWLELVFLDSDLKNFDPTNRTFTYINDKGYILAFKTPEKKEYTWLDAL
jgi:ATPase family protein associated with various cellular activities (AAA)